MKCVYPVNLDKQVQLLVNNMCRYDIPFLLIYPALISDILVYFVHR